MTLHEEPEPMTDQTIDLAAIREAHIARTPRVLGGYDGPPLCRMCLLYWPCDAFRSADEVDRLRALLTPERLAEALWISPLFQRAVVVRRRSDADILAAAVLATLGVDR